MQAPCLFIGALHQTPSAPIRATWRFFGRHQTGCPLPISPAARVARKMNHNAKIKKFEKNRLDKQNQGASVERFYEYFAPKGLRCVPQWYASVPRGAKDRKRSELSGELSRAEKRARNRKCSRCSRGDKIDIGCNVKRCRVLSGNIKRNELPIELRKNPVQ